MRAVNHRTRTAAAAAAANMRFQALFFLMLLTCMYLSLAQGSYGNCCLRYTQKAEKVHIKMVQEYRMQETDGDCNIPAVVIVLKKGPNNKSRTICANPQMDKIKKLVEKMDGRNLRRAP